LNIIQSKNITEAKQWKMAQSVETPISQGEANNLWKSTMYNDLIRFYGNPSDVPFLRKIKK